MKLTEEKASVLRRNIDISLLILPVGLGDIIETILVVSLQYLIQVLEEYRRADQSMNTVQF